VKKTIRLCVLALAIVLAGNLAMGDFYVIPAVKKMFAPVARTGQTTSYWSWDDGELQKGVAWPNPRFTDSGNGTVTDNLTGLVWTKDADCDGVKTWAHAIAYCSGLQDGWCGLTDGSSPLDWRLPSVRELQSLIHYGFSGPAVPNTAGTGKWSEGDPFTDVKSPWYWTSTTSVEDTGCAWNVAVEDGYVSFFDRNATDHVWCVRGGR